MTEEQRAVFQVCTGRSISPTASAHEAWLVVGRRGGKSFVLALVAVFIACFLDHRQHLAPGERGTVMLIARDRRQARIILRYIGALLRVPLLAQMVERETAEGFDVGGQVTVEVHTASFRSTRGYAIIAALCDELAFWPTEDATDPAYEVISALRPGMAQFPDALLLCASSPYARKGTLFDAHHQHFGRDGDPVLVWQAPTRTMNPTIPQSVIDEAMDRDPVSAAAEYGAEFRSDIEGFVSRQAVEACVADGLFERPPESNLRYAAFTDPSGGSVDSFTLAVAHREVDRLVLDCLREARPPFSPESVVGEFAQVLRSYRVSKVVGDRYAGEWPREQFRKHGIVYQTSEKSKSDLYVDLLPLINSRRIALLDHPRFVSQICTLERRTARSGRDSIDHPPSGHDDLANAAAGALLAAQTIEQRRLRMFTLSQGPGGPPSVEIDPRTLQPLGPEPTRIKVVRVREADAPAVRWR